MLNAYEIAGMRTTSASAQPDTCTISRPSGEPTFNEATLDLEPAAELVVYVGPCRVRPRDGQELDAEVGDLHETLGGYVCTLPALASVASIVSGDPNSVAVDDILTVDTSTDSAMTGRAFRVVHVGKSAWQIDRRLGLEDREQPPGIGAAS